MTARSLLRRSSSRLRRVGADYLAYALLDAVIDSYFPVVERFADELDNLDEEMEARHGPEINNRIHAVRNDLLILR